MIGRVAVYAGVRRPLEIREYPVPEPPAGGMVARIRQANVCGSELHFWRGHGPAAAGTPIVFGHEAVATVAALGEGTAADSMGQPLAVGDRIVYSYFKPCGRCWACLSGKSTCPDRNRDWLGAGADSPPHFRGAFADYFWMDGGHWVFKVPDELPDELVSPVNCALAEMLYALDRAGITQGDTVLIQGAGGLGLYAAALAREAGAGRVVVVDRIPARLELARLFGADLTLNAAETTPEQRKTAVLDLSGGIGADLAVEVTGSAAVLPEGIELLRPGGTYLWIGAVGIGETVAIEPAQVIRLNKRILGVVAYEKWVIPRALGFLQRTRGRYPFERIISHQFPFERVTDALAAADEGRCIRAGVVL
jgi:threonine dehydrogenase-like Zn-dependent dehydrogenase